MNYQEQQDIERSKQRGADGDSYDAPYSNTQAREGYWDEKTKRDYARNTSDLWPKPETPSTFGGSDTFIAHPPLTPDEIERRNYLKSYNLQVALKSLTWILGVCSVLLLGILYLGFVLLDQPFNDTNGQNALKWMALMLISFVLFFVFHLVHNPRYQKTKKNYNEYLKTKESNTYQKNS